jgi:hypothetical protein
MADIAAFPTIGPSFVGGPTKRFIAGADIKANQVVCYPATGVTDTVEVYIVGAGQRPVGVAVFPAASGAPVTVAVDGAEIDVVNADDTATIDAGDALEGNDNAVGGTVSAITETGSGATATLHWMVAQAKEDIGAGGYGKAIVKVVPLTQPNAS